MKQRPSFPAQLERAGDRPVPAVKAVTKVQALDLAPAAASKLGRPAPVVGARAPARTVVPARTPAHGDFAAVRTNMVAKIAAQGVVDATVLAAMSQVERHRFVDSGLHAQAYEDTSLPIGLGQTISKPGVVARMLELLRKQRPGLLGRVLEIGTGCGYQAAVLSLLASEVYSMERLRGLHDRARENLRPLRLANLHLLFGDGMAGFAKGAPYAGIIAAAGGEAVPQAWTDQLAVGGRLVAPVAMAVGAHTQQVLVVIDKTARGLRQSVHEAVHFVPLRSGLA